MTLIQWEAMKDIEDIFDRTAQSLAWPLGRRGGWPPLLAISPRVDIFEQDGSYVIEADVPGIAREDLHVSVEDGVLTISGARRQDKREDRGRCHRLERFSGSFLRSFTLPADSDCSGLSARCQEGQLMVTVPRKASTAAATAVDVPVQ